MGHIGMGVETTKYIRKPLYVDAVRVSPKNFDEIADWCDGKVQRQENNATGTTKKYIKVNVDNPRVPRQTKAFIGDWILRTERGFKVYTNKAFGLAFDRVGEEVFFDPTEDQISGVGNMPKFYLHPHSDEITEDKPFRDAVPLTLSELTNIIRNELTDSELDNSEATITEIKARQEEEAPKEPKPPRPSGNVGPEIRIHDASFVAEDPDPTGTGVQPIHDVQVTESPEATEDEDLQKAAQESGHPIDPAEQELETTTPQGERITLVPATPQAIADVVNEQQPVERDGEDHVGVRSGGGEREVVLSEEENETIEKMSSEESARLARKHEAMQGESPREDAAGEYPETHTIGGTPREEINVGGEQPVEVKATPSNLNGKTVLSEIEQKRMGPERVRDLVRSGEAILAQDLA